ncbi:MAG: MFS transporter [Hyphomicrobiaceae bacterium]
MQNAAKQSTPAATSPDPCGRGGRRYDRSRDPFRWLVLFGVWLIYCSFGIVIVSLAPLVPEIMQDLAVSHTMMGAIFGSWQVAFIIAAVPCGALLDHIGVRRGLLLGAFAVALSAFMRSYANSDIALLFAVAIFGLGGPIVSTGAPKIVTQWFAGQERGFAMGIYVTGPAVGGIISLSLTNALLLPLFDNDWRAVQRLWAVCAVTTGMLWLIIAAHPRMRDAEQRERQGTKPSQLSTIKELLQLPAVQLLMAMSVGIFAFNHALNNWLPEILRAKGLTAVEAGYWASVPTVIGLIGSLTIPRLATAERRNAMLIALCAGAVIATLLIHAQPGTALASGLILQGVARSSMMTIALLILVEMREIGEARAATASGLFFSAAEVGGAGGPLMLGAVHSATGGFAAGLGILTIVTSLLLAASICLRTKLGNVVT